MNWTYKITSGVALREAIDDENVEQTVKCLLFCYKELFGKLSDEDRDYIGYDIEDTIAILTLYMLEPDDEDDINYYLNDFYNLCDELGAWVCTINEEL